jgi:hypothetical protein
MTCKRRDRQTVKPWKKHLEMESPTNLLPSAVLNFAGFRNLRLRLSRQKSFVGSGPGLLLQWRDRQCEQIKAMWILVTNSAAITLPTPVAACQMTPDVSLALETHLAAGSSYLLSLSQTTTSAQSAKLCEGLRNVGFPIAIMSVEQQQKVGLVIIIIPELIQDDFYCQIRAQYRCFRCPSSTRMFTR